ncbi:narB (nitrate reductase) [Cylindrospermopsis raciborskii S07]|uniref:molybdopterin oxidoreductase family protein n=1 Tax=Cylindrospermopsis raciborskii TaxID=77022 RepID=UPI000C9E7B20|nr:nitrate reductase [Cylindrospermopsis raciborskii]PNK01367.1 narB (nitrate reductase) [Cylindrospermopsis raciborskii S10]PNK02766.1 narB (nitrate reductase) [Cylindrospermopsis raciborskii S14]PNK08423.1 narB (nitrate reductase) [Cylindrospermopsis raciborskii S07]PNK12628.1 narB (nitrate reductase) [Cylindrospermopsis raciborskii S06]PNK20520.1 narB (nitrate reductase) [Cylindrospermopsis raciborskii S05]
MTEFIKTLCPYCGVGCGLEVSSPTQHPSFTTDNTGDQETVNWRVRGDKSHPSSQGMVCVKGATVAEAIYKNRLQYPMFRESLTQDFRLISWEDSFTIITNHIQQTLVTHGPESICMYGSGQFQTEDYYIAQKLLKGCLGTNNFDANSRLCMSSAVSGYLQSFGADGPPCCYDDLELTDCVFLIGTNTAECHPIIFNRLSKYHKKNPHVKMVVVDPRSTPTAKTADLHLAIVPGTDIDLLNGIAHLLVKWNSWDVNFVDNYTSNFADYIQVINYYSPDLVTSRCGISLADLETAAKYWGQAQSVLSLWSMGVNQSSEGTAKVRSIIDLHLLTGQVGKPGAGPFSLTGQPNAMGGREAGGLAHLLPGYRLIKNPQHRLEVEEFWGLKPGTISPIPGLNVWEMIMALESGNVQLLWIAATNPAVSMPDLERTKKALLQSPFTIYQDAYYPTETANYAHLLLPAAQWGEKTGVMTNSERRITLSSAFKNPPQLAKSDWEIFAEVGRRLGFSHQFNFHDSSEVYREFVQLTLHRPCDMSGLSHEFLTANGPTHWPFSQDNYQEVKRLYTDLRFHTHDGKAQFAACFSRGLAEPPDPEYPFILTSGRLYGHWHTQTRTGRIDKICQMHPEPFLEIHPRDALKLQLADHQLVMVRSRRGAAEFPAKITLTISPGTVFVPMHWGKLWAENSEANALTHSASCPDSFQPELKACAVQLIPIQS